jgi:hypothetical protein
MTQNSPEFCDATLQVESFIVEGRFLGGRFPFLSLSACSGSGEDKASARCHPLDHRHSLAQIGELLNLGHPHQRVLLPPQPFVQYWSILQSHYSLCSRAYSCLSTSTSSPHTYMLFYFWPCQHPSRASPILLFCLFTTTALYLPFALIASPWLLSDIVPQYFVNYTAKYHLGYSCL